MLPMTGNITHLLVMTHTCIYTVIQIIIIKITTSSMYLSSKNLVIVHAIKAPFSQSVNKTKV